MQKYKSQGFWFLKAKVSILVKNQKLIKLTLLHLQWINNLLFKNNNHRRMRVLLHQKLQQILLGLLQALKSMSDNTNDVEVAELERPCKLEMQHIQIWDTIA